MHLFLWQGVASGCVWGGTNMVACYSASLISYGATLIQGPAIHHTPPPPSKPHLTPHIKECNLDKDIRVTKPTT